MCNIRVKLGNHFVLPTPLYLFDEPISWNREAKYLGVTQVHSKKKSKKNILCQSLSFFKLTPFRVYIDLLKLSKAF